MFIDSRHPWLRQFFLVALMCAALCGCGGGREGTNLPLNEEDAREACRSFLTAWKSGEKSADLAPDIIGKDEDWDAGQKLVSFEVLPNEMNDGSNLHIPVQLTLRDKQQRSSVLNVTYTVGTYPSVTVFRD